MYRCSESRTPGSCVPFVPFLRLGTPPNEATADCPLFAACMFRHRAVTPTRVRRDSTSLFRAETRRRRATLRMEWCSRWPVVPSWVACSLPKRWPRSQRISRGLSVASSSSLRVRRAVARHDDPSRGLASVRRGAGELWEFHAAAGLVFVHDRTQVERRWRGAIARYGDLFGPGARSRAGTFGRAVRRPIKAALPVVL